MTPTQSAATTAFWQWLNLHQHRLPSLTQDDAPFWDDVLGRLKAIDEGLWLELSVDADPGEIVLTAGGDTDLFELVEEVAARAPPMAGWQVIALKPAMGFGFVANWENVRLDPKELWFEPRDQQDWPDVLGLRVAAPDYTADDDAAFRNSLLTLLDTALGERAAAESVYLIEVVDVPPDPAAASFLPLVDLAACLAGRAKPRAAAGG